MAKQLLSAFGWQVEQAVDSFFTDGIPDGMEEDEEEAQPAVNAAAVTKLFEKYKDTKEDRIDVDGIQRFCDDLGVDPADVVMLVLAWRMDALLMCTFTRAEFVGGMGKLRCDSIVSLKARLPALRRQLDEPDAFQSSARAAPAPARPAPPAQSRALTRRPARAPRRAPRPVYMFAFEYARSSESAQKSLGLETAVEMWRLVLHGRWALLEPWTQFLQAEATHAISRDTWQLLHDFVRTVKPDLSNYDEDGAPRAASAPAPAEARGSDSCARARRPPLALLRAGGYRRRVAFADRRLHDLVAAASAAAAAV